MSFSYVWATPSAVHKEDHCTRGAMPHAHGRVLGVAREARATHPIARLGPPIRVFSYDFFSFLVPTFSFLFCFTFSTISFLLYFLYFQWKSLDFEKMEILKNIIDFEKGSF
jgi:hypothetical protein